MNRTLINIIIDLIAALLFLGMIATGYLLRFPLPPGSNKTYALWGLTRHQWGDIHFWISLGLLLTMLLHLVLHWNWIVTVIGKRCGLVKNKQPSLFRCGAWTVAGLALISIGFACLVRESVTEIERPRHGLRGAGKPAQIMVEKNPSTEIGNDSPEWAQIYPIFQKNCLGCHGPQNPSAGFRVDLREAFFNADGPWVVPGQAENSALIAIITGLRPNMAMADAHRLSDADVFRIKAWIANGAK
ncbi:DUF4405 domain-containing protein [Methylomonas sp. MgM2]